MTVKQETCVSRLSNGLAVVVEEIPHVESVAWELCVPGGVVLDQEDYLGSCLVLSELSSRGAGPFSSRELSEAFENRGIRHSESAGIDRFSYRGAALGSHLAEGLKLLSFMVLEPKLPADEISSIQSLLLQDLASLADNPARRVMVELAARYFPGVWSRSHLGTEEGIKRCNARQQKLDWERLFTPEGSVLSVAGNCKTSEVLQIAERCFGGWSGKSEAIPAFGAMPAHARHHIQIESSQLQIALAWPSAPFGHPKYYPAKIANGVISGGMFGRLFTEVREKRGLVYSVYARHQGTAQHGTVMAYAGTTPERAQETLNVMLEVIRNLKGTVTDEELKRVKANSKSGIVIGEESSSSRAGSNAHDWWLMKRLRSLDEIISELDAVKASDIDSYLEEFPAESFMSITLGSKKIN